MKYGRIVNNIIQEVFIEENGKTLSNSFHPDMASLFQEIPEHAESGYYYENGIWNPYPEGPAQPEPTDSSV